MAARWPTWLAVVLAIALAATTMLPVASAGPAGQVYSGKLFLVEGWLAVLGGQPAWLANPALLVVIAYLARGRRVPGAVGGFLAACFVGALFVATLPSNAGDVPIRAFHAGYYLWMLLVGVGAVSPLLRLPPRAGPAA